MIESIIKSRIKTLIGQNKLVRNRFGFDQKEWPSRVLAAYKERLIRANELYQLERVLYAQKQIEALKEEN